MEDYNDINNVCEKPNKPMDGKSKNRSYSSNVSCEPIPNENIPYGTEHCTPVVDSEYPEICPLNSDLFSEKNISMDLRKKTHDIQNELEESATCFFKEEHYLIEPCKESTQGPVLKYTTKEEMQDEETEGENESNSDDEGNIDDPLALVATVMNPRTEEVAGTSRERLDNERGLMFPCDKCTVKFSSVLYLATHMKNCKSKKQSFDELKKGLLSTRRGNKKKSYCCAHCSYVTTKPWHLRDHLLTHSGEKPFTCDVCGKAFARSDGLATHKRIHSGKNLLKCNECDYTSYRAGNLKLHMARHTGENVLVCPHCPYKTACGRDMTTHARTHSGEKPFNCSLCYYRTAYSSALSGHMKTHTGEKPHACPYCHYRSIKKGDLSKHVTNKHSDETM